VLFGPCDHRTRTEDRVAPPRIAVGEQVRFGSIAATVAATAGRRLELLTVQTAYAALPWSSEMPSAGAPSRDKLNARREMPIHGVVSTWRRISRKPAAQVETHEPR
jgi:hypothetical protein